MKFYNRNKELQLLHDWEELSAEAAQMTIVIGRRRVGKTTLIKKAFENKKMIYFFCTKKNEVLLCEEFVAIAKDILGTDILEYRNFRDLFRYLMRISTEQNFTLVIDEFQEFYYINPAIYSSSIARSRIISCLSSIDIITICHVPHIKPFMHFLSNC